ncbi:MAG: hypothetical protein OXE59_01160 [Bacteroidetes bacterium]|nr:hypothetical protein [Bacteroidota bacterium]
MLTIFRQLRLRSLPPLLLGRAFNFNAIGHPLRSIPIIAELNPVFSGQSTEMLITTTS